MALFGVKKENKQYKQLSSLTYKWENYPIQIT